VKISDALLDTKTGQRYYCSIFYDIGRGLFRLEIHIFECVNNCGTSYNNSSNIGVEVGSGNDKR